MRKLVSVWAPPAIMGWGAEVLIHSFVNGSKGTMSFSLSFGTESDAPSSFDVVIIQPGLDPVRLVGPGSYDGKFRSMGTDKVSIQAKSHSLGQS